MKLAINVCSIFGFVFLFYSFGTSGPAVTYRLNGNRLGDNLMAYAHARYLALLNNVPFYYQDFQYSNQLYMHEMHTPIAQAPKYDEEKHYPMWPEMGHKEENFSLDLTKNILYIIPYFPGSSVEATQLNLWHFDVDWHNPEFKAILQQEIRPLRPFKKFSFPTDKQCIAVHVRKGGGFDQLFQKIKRWTINADKNAPLKFPPDLFYIESIKKASTFNIINLSTAIFLLMILIHKQLLIIIAQKSIVPLLPLAAVLMAIIMIIMYSKIFLR